MLAWELDIANKDQLKPEEKEGQKEDYRGRKFGVTPEPDEDEPEVKVEKLEEKEDKKPIIDHPKTPRKQQPTKTIAEPQIVKKSGSCYFLPIAVIIGCILSIIALVVGFILMKQQY